MNNTFNWHLFLDNEPNVCSDPVSNNNLQVLIELLAQYAAAN